MCWRLRFSKFTFEIVFKKKDSTTQAIVLSRHGALRHLTAPLDNEIPTFQGDHMTRRERVAILSVSNVSKYPTISCSRIGTFKIHHWRPLTRQCCQESSTTDVLPQHSRKNSRILFSLACKVEKIVLRSVLQTKVLHLCHYAVPSGHSGRGKLYHFRSFCQLFMSIVCYETVPSCVTSTRSGFDLYKQKNSVRLYSASTLPEFVSIDILEKLVSVPRTNKYFLVISDGLSKLVRTVPLNATTAKCVAKEFATH